MELLISSINEHKQAFYNRLIICIVLSNENKIYMKKIVLMGFMYLGMLAPVAAQGYCGRDECYSAEINGSPFTFRDYWQVNTLLLRQQSSMDGRVPSRKVITINFNGNTYLDSAKGKQFDESIQLEIVYEEEMIGTPSVYTISAHYKGTNYSVLKGKNDLVITDFIWEGDQRSFRITANINCTMHAWGEPLNSGNDIVLKAHVENALVDVPGWLLSSKN